MYYYNKKSIFFIDADQKGSTEFENDEFGDMKVKITLVNELGDVYFIDRNDKKIIAQRVIFDEPTNVEEGIPVFAWSITGQRKNIAEYDCHEATTSFRGRSFSAWFTPEVPLDVGPWKFSGLPGAILQVNDEEGRYNWYCKSIGKLLPKYKELIKAPQNNKIFSPKEFQNLAIGKIMEMMEKMTTDPNVNITSEPNNKASLERTFN
jgi:GLPGLI family protein